MLPTPKIVALHPAYRGLLDVLEAHYVSASIPAARWGWSEQHLANLRKSGKGPAFVRLGRSVRYSTAEILAWEISGQSSQVTADRVSLACAALQGLSLDQRASVAQQLQSILFARKV